MERSVIHYDMGDAVPAELAEAARRVREAALEAVRMAAESKLPEDEHLSFAQNGPGLPRVVVHEHDGGCLDCGGAKRAIRCARHPGVGCDCDGEEVACESCEGSGKAYVEDCTCPACMTVSAVLEEVHNG